MKIFQKLIAAPALISLASGFAINAAEINSTDLSNYSNSNDLVSLGDFKSELKIDTYYIQIYSKLNEIMPSSY